MTHRNNEHVAKTREVSRAMRAAADHGTGEAEDMTRAMEAIRAVAKERANPSTNALALRPKGALAIRYE